MYEVYVETFFSSAHKLKNYKGKCEHLHGHNWKIGVMVRSKNLNSEDMVIDFKILKNIINKVLMNIDHKYLNDIDYFKKNQPTAENIAKYLHLQISKQIKIKIFSLKIIVWETPIQYASYEK